MLGRALRSNYVYNKLQTGMVAWSVGYKCISSCAIQHMAY